MSLVLAVDDEPNVLSSIARLLGSDGHQVLTVKSGGDALERLGGCRPDLVLTDLRMVGMCGLETLRRIKALAPDVPVVLMTGHGSTDSAIEAMKLGAFDYLIKPFQASELRLLVARALATTEALRASEAAGAPEAGAPGDLDAQGERMLGRSPAMFEVYKAIGQFAGSDATVLIRGESGTGKEKVARAIHRHSPRAAKPFVAVNCAALPETLLESELFGYEKGAFTGADARRIGRFEQADGGTVLLDEVGDMSPMTQAKVLRLLQERTFERLGSGRTFKVDVRLLAATHTDLEERVRRSVFRPDLYYRLRVATIQVPALRERTGDIQELASYFLERLRQSLGKRTLRIAPEALRRMQSYPWPGNVRELEHCLHQAALLCRQDVILAEHLRLDEPRAVAKQARALRSLTRELLERSPGQAHPKLIAQVESQAIAEALEMSKGNLSRAARTLGLSRPTLREKIQRYGLRPSAAAAEELE